MKSPEERQIESEGRWSKLLQRSIEPVFVLNRTRRILYVNLAWESLTGRKLEDVRGWVCKRRARPATPGSPEALQQVLAPSPDALEGKTSRVRRRYLESATRPHWWDIEFLPLSDSQGIIGYIGKISPRPTAAGAATPLPEKIVALRQQLVDWYRLDEITSIVPVVERMVRQIRQAAKTRGPVAILGEKGAGKQWAARAIHYQADSERSFACVDCATLPERVLTELLSSDGLTGSHGLTTLYLKDAERLPRELQTQLAERLASSEEHTPRLLAGFVRDPREAVQAGDLLDDFYCALSATTVHVPPLRERAADIPLLAEQFLSRLAVQDQTPAKEPSPEMQEVLRLHTWPGNLRELFDVLRSAARRAKTPRIDANDLPFYLRSESPAKERTMPLDKILEEVEKRLITLAMNLSQNNKTKAAEILAVWRPRLIRRLQAFGMEAESGEE